MIEMVVPAVALLVFVMIGAGVAVDRRHRRSMYNALSDDLLDELRETRLAAETAGKFPEVSCVNAGDPERLEAR